MGMHENAYPPKNPPKILRLDATAEHVPRSFSMDTLRRLADSYRFSRRNLLGTPMLRGGGEGPAGLVMLVPVVADKKFETWSGAMLHQSVLPKGALRRPKETQSRR